MDVEFQDLSYVIPRSRWTVKSSDKVILHSVSGLFKPGELSAIMGPSGAGKSSLLNALSGYRSTGVSGALLTNGKPRDERVFRSRSCYITQEDTLQPLMTVKELMMYAAKLKQPSHTTREEMDNTVSDIIDKLGLSTSTETRTERLSGGQKKRVSVALELINNPPVFFLDEPTSGLDNVSSTLCLKMLRSLARQGRTIVCTIHQPSALLFALFDRVYVLAQGRCVYQGATTGLITFLEATGMHCPLSYNPADYVIEITDGEEASNVEKLSTAIQNGKIEWKESAISDRTTTDIEDYNGDRTKLDKCDAVIALKSDTDDITSLGFASSPWTQFATLWKRMFLQLMRNKIGLQIQLFHHVFCGLILMILFAGSGDDSERWFVIIKCIIGIVVFHTYTWIIVPTLSYPLDVTLMKREYFNRWHGFTVYYSALTLSTMPTKFLFTLIFTTIIYITLRLPFGFERFTVIYLVAIIVSLTAEGLGFAIGATFSVTNGAPVGSACIAPLLGLAVYGFDFAKSIPLFTAIIMKLSFVRSGVVAMVMASFGMDRPLLGCSDPLGFCYFQDPKRLLQMLGVEPGASVWWQVLLLCGILAFFRILFFVALRIRLKT